MAGPVVDVGGAIALASAAGIAGPVAARMIAAAAEGVVIGYTERRQAERDAEAGDDDGTDEGAMTS